MPSRIGMSWLYEMFISMSLNDLGDGSKLGNTLSGPLEGLNGHNLSHDARTLDGTRVVILFSTGYSLTCARTRDVDNESYNVS